MSLDHILLGLLQDPSTGYDLKRTFSKSIRHFWSAELSQIYPSLKRLESKGWLRSRVEPSSKGPNRKIYRLTAAGRRVLLAWLRRGPIVGSERFAYLAQLYFMDAVGDLDETRAFLIALRRHHATWLDTLRATERQIVETFGEVAETQSDRVFHRYASLRMGIHAVTAKVAWCDETLAAVDRRLAQRRPSSPEPHQPEVVS